MPKSTKQIVKLICLAMLLTTFSLKLSLSYADTVQYFYDELGRLIQVVNNSTITDYSYDEVGNILSVSNGSLTDTPSITSVTPNTLVVGTRSVVTFAGQNLLSFRNMSSLGGNTVVSGTSISANQITAMLTAQNAGADTLKVSFRDNANTTHQTNITAVAAAVVMTPPLAVAPPNSVATMLVSLNPPLTADLTLNIKTDNPSVATVPYSITIPAGGAASLQINTKAVGAASITSLDGFTYGYVYSEKPIENGEAVSYPVSVMIEPTVTSTPAVNVSRPVSVMVEAPVFESAQAVTSSKPVSVTVAGTATPVGPSVSMSRPVSIQIEPAATAITPSTTVSAPVSITITQ